MKKIVGSFFTETSSFDRGEVIIEKKKKKILKNYEI